MRAELLNPSPEIIVGRSKLTHYLNGNGYFYDFTNFFEIENTDNLDIDPQFEEAHNDFLNVKICTDLTLNFRCPASISEFSVKDSLFL